MHVCPSGQKLVAQSLLIGTPVLQNPSPVKDSKQWQSGLPLQLNTLAVLLEGHVRAQWQSPPTGTPFFLRHLHLALHLCLASASRGKREGATAATSAPPASLSARLLEMAPSSSPLARSSKNCSPTAPFPLQALLKYQGKCTPAFGTAEGSSGPGS